MPIYVYLYCITITFSSVYSISVLKVKPTYMLGAALFVTFCWLICIDYYAEDPWIFSSQITFAIYMLCAMFWQVIEFKSLMAYMREKNGENMKELNAMQDEIGETGAMFFVIIIFAPLVFIFYLPILYMGYCVFTQIPTH